MSEKHYTISYLENTQQLMKDLKMQSYSPLGNIEEGLIADIGCGVGADVLNMAKLFANPHLQWAGVDHDAQMIAKANSQKEGMDRVQFYQSEVSALPFDSESVSGMRAERLLQHIAQPETVYAEVLRCLKKDRPFVVVETDWQSISFYSVAAETSQQIADFYTHTKVKNGLAARKLNTELRQAGFRDLQFKVIPMVTSSYEEAKMFLWVDKMIAEMQELGLLCHDQKTQLLQEFEIADKAGYFVASINMVIATCIK